MDKKGFKIAINEKTHFLPISHDNVNGFSTFWARWIQNLIFFHILKFLGLKVTIDSSYWSKTMKMELFRKIRRLSKALNGFRVDRFSIFWARWIRN